LAGPSARSERERRSRGPASEGPARTEGEAWRPSSPALPRAASEASEAEGLPVLAAAHLLFLLHLLVLVLDPEVVELLVVAVLVGVEAVGDALVVVTADAAL